MNWFVRGILRHFSGHIARLFTEIFEDVIMEIAEHKDDIPTVIKNNVEKYLGKSHTNLDDVKK